MQTEAGERSVTINIRASRRMRDLIDHAAHLTGKSRTEFMLETARRAAEDALLDQRNFILDDDRYRRFVDALDAPAEPNVVLKTLLRKTSPWEK